MSAVILQDEIVHYEVLGRGRPLIFLHGWVGSWRYWIPSMQAASVTFRAYAIDLWGFGDSTKDQSRYTIEQQVNLIDNFLDKLGIGRIALVGHGLGAVVALNFAAAKPEIVDRVMAVGFPLDGNQVNPRLRTATPVELADWLLGRIPAAESARVEAPKADILAVQTSLNNLQNVDLVDFSAHIVTPCLFVHGQNDPAITPPQVEDNTNLPEHTHQVIFEQSGHFPMLDETSKFNRLLSDFLSLQSGESPRQLQLKEEWKRRVR
ncbi:MAG: alpha/beta hydrolase [Chloroflexota bacterium]|nr:MAG: alpha/beta hydrolase [Chloroflexota bacterium]